MSQGEDECTKLIWDAFKDEESFPLCVCLFLHNIMQAFQNSVKVLESNYISSTELHDILLDLRKKIVDKKKDKYYGKLVMDKLKVLTENKKEKFTSEADHFMERCLVYLDKWYDFENSSFKDMRFLSLKNPVQWEEFQELSDSLQLDLDADKLHEDFCLLREIQPALFDASDRVDMRWMEFFQKTKDKNCGEEMKKLVSFVLSIPVSNAACERKFSVMGQTWTKERNKLSKELLKAELQVCHNYQMSCSEFHAFVLKNPKLLNSSQK